MCTDCFLFLYAERLWTRRHRLLRSMEAVQSQALRLLRLFGNTTSRKSMSRLSVLEQEYFLVDHEKYLQDEKT